MIYIKFNDKKHIRKKQSFFNIAIKKVLTTLLPRTNPDFEDIIGKVAIWSLEFRDDNSLPEREVGLNSKGETIVKMPFKKNIGYWVDNSLKYEDFVKIFETEAITKEQFEEQWSKL